MRDMAQRLRRLEQQTTGFTKDVMCLVSGSANEIAQMALERTGVSAAVRGEVAHAAMQGFAVACEACRFPLHEEALERFLDIEAIPAENVMRGALTAEEHTRYVEARTALYAEIGKLTSASLYPLYDGWLRRHNSKKLYNMERDIYA